MTRQEACAIAAILDCMRAGYRFIYDMKVEAEGKGIDLTPPPAEIIAKMDLATIAVKMLTPALMAESDALASEALEAPVADKRLN